MPGSQQIWLSKSFLSVHIHTQCLLVIFYCNGLQQLETCLENVTADETGYEVVEGVILVAGGNIQAGGCQAYEHCQDVRWGHI